MLPDTPPNPSRSFVAEIDDLRSPPNTNRSFVTEFRVYRQEVALLSAQLLFRFPFTVFPNTIAAINDD